MFQRIKLGLIGAAFLLAPSLSWAAKAKHPVLGNPSAPTGGTFYVNLSAEPDSLNPINTSDYYQSVIQGYVDEGLLWLNPQTNKYEPNLAESYKVSKDYLTYTFHLRKDLKWSDGQPLTSADVKFSFDCIKDPAYKAAAKLPYFTDIKSIETPDPLTIVIKMKKKYFKNLEVLADGGFTPILPKHLYGDPAKAMSKVIYGSGEYKLASYDRGKSLTLVRNANWWGLKDPRFKGRAKFDKIFFRFVSDSNLAFAMIKKGQLDVLATTPEIFVKKAVGKPFGTDIKKVQVENQDATRKGYTYIGWNEKDPLFKDKNVRLALSYLVNRKQMNEKFRYNLSDLATGPTYYRNTLMVDKSVKPIPFSIKKANELLKKAGWADSDKDGILDKMIDGKKVDFRFEILIPSQDAEKYMTMYKEALQKAGIDMSIKRIEWANFTRLMEEKKFQAIYSGWSVGSPEQDLKQIWHSSSIRDGGSNMVSYSNPNVDKWIDEGRMEMNPAKRHRIWKKIYRQIAEDVPYTFMFSTRYDLYLVRSRIGMVAPTMKYSRGQDFWWMAKP